MRLLNRPARSLLESLAVAVLLTAVVPLLHYTAGDVMQGDMPLMTSLLAVMMAAWYGGLWPGLLATVLCALTSVTLFLPGGWQLELLHDQLLLAGFLFIGSAMSLLFEAMDTVHAELGAGREQARAERALIRKQALDAELRHRLVIESTHDLIYEWVSKNGQVFRNDAMTTLFGYPREAVDGRAEWWIERIHPADRGRAQASLRAAWASEHETWSAEYRVRCADGSHKWVLDRARLVYDAAGAPLRMIGAVQDIGDRQRHVEAMTHFKALFEAQPAPTLVLDRQFRIVAASDAFLRSTMRERADIVGHHVFEAFPDDADAAGIGPLGASFEKVLATGVSEQLPLLSYAVRKPVSEGGGFEKLWWSVYNFPVRGPDNEVALVVHRADDMTQYVREHLSAEASNAGTPIEVPAAVIESTRSLEHAQLLAEANRRLGAINRRLALLAELSEATRLLGDAEQIVALVAEKLVRHLGASRCVYLELDSDGDSFLILGGFAADVDTMTGGHRLRAFSEELWRYAHAGRTHVVADVQTDPALADDVAAWRAASIQAAISVPLMKDGRPVAGLAVHASTRRAWTQDEIELVQQLAERCWESLARVRATRALISRESQLREMLDTMPAKLSTATADGRLDYLHPLWLSYAGLRFEDVGGDAWDRLFHPDDLPAYRLSRAASIGSGTPFTHEIRVRRHDGEYRWHLAQLTPVRDEHGGIRSWVGATTEVHELKLAQETLRARALQLGFLVELSNQVQALDDPAAIMARVTEAVRAHLAADRCAYVEMDADQEHYEVCADATRDLPSRVGRHSFKFFGAEATRMLRANQAYSLDDTQAALVDSERAAFAQAQVGALIFYPLNTGERFVAALAIHQREGRRWTHDEIEQVGLLARMSWAGVERAKAVQHLRTSNERLRQTDRAKDEFIAMLAHELRNPIGPIANGVQLLQRAGEDHKLRSQTLELMTRQLAQLVRLVDDLLDVSRITSGKLVLRRGPVALSEVVSSAVETVDLLIRAGGHRLQIELPSEPIVLDADATRVAQVLSNLLANSAKYSDAPGTIQLSAAAEGGEARITVQDQGIGIRPEMLSRVFEMFTQSDRALSRAQGGLGIGLALVRRLVELHGGRVEAASEGPGRGSTFTVHLPRSTSSPVPVPQADLIDAVDARAGTSKRRVLVADDNDDSARSLAALLRIWGHEVVIVHDGIAAVERAAEFRPDAMVLDLGMPRRDGLATAVEVRAQDWGHGINLIALSGWGAPADRERTRAAGFDHHLVKPVESAVLEQLLQGAGSHLS